MREEARVKQRLDEQAMALRLGREFQDGMIVNLGMGIPTLAANFIPEGREVLFHAENGCLGYGPLATSEEEMDFDLINPAAQFITSKPGMSLFDHAEAFAMIRGRHIDLCALGAFQVSEKGDIANWLLPGKKIGNIGGGIDLASRANNVIAVLTHTTKAGEPKIVKECSYELTGRKCVSLIITDIAVIAVTEDSLVLKEVAPGWTAEEVQRLTESRLTISPDLKEIEL
ncbi:3-oxoacid CoA-transferase subunit B [Chloroflexota bacterium]